MNDGTPEGRLLVTSRCRLTTKGRLHMDPARDASFAATAARGLSLNATGRYVLERCDGIQSVSDLACALAQAWQVPETRALADVLTFLERLREQGFVRAEE